MIDNNSDLPMTIHYTWDSVLSTWRTLPYLMLTRVTGNKNRLRADATDAEAHTGLSGSHIHALSSPPDHLLIKYVAGMCPFLEKRSIPLIHLFKASPVQNGFNYCDAVIKKSVLIASRTAPTSSLFIFSIFLVLLLCLLFQVNFS